MVDQIQRIVLAYDEGNSKAKLEEFNRTLEKQNQAALKAADGLAKAAREQRESEKAAERAAKANSQLEKEFAKIRYENATKGMRDAQAATESYSTTALTHFRGLATAYATLSAAAVGYLYTIDRLAAEGQKLVDLERSFKTLTEESGFTKISIEGLRQATFGLLDTTTLLTQANTAMVLGLPGDELEDLYQKTIRLARAQGVDSVRAIESITIGIARQSKLYLDNLGILVDTEKAYKKMAAANNTTVEGLTDAQKRTAFYQATLEALNTKLAYTADVQLSVADASTQLKNTAKDAFAEVGKGVTNSDDLAKSLTFLRDQLEKVDWVTFGENLAKVTGKMLEFAGIFATFATGAYSIENAVDSATKKNLEGAKSLEDYNRILTTYQGKIAENQKQIDKLKLPAFLEKVPGVGIGLSLVGDNDTAKLKELEEYNRALGDSVVDVQKHYADAALAMFGFGKEGEQAAKNVKKETEETGNAADDAAKKIAGLVEKFKLEGAADQVKGLGQALNDAIKEVDTNAFDSILPQFEASFRKLKLDELTEKYKDAIGKGITTADIAALADSETQKAADQLRDQLTEAVEKSADAFDKLQRDLDWSDMQDELERAIETMDKGAFDVVSQEMEAQFKKVRFDELRKQLGENIGDPQVWDIVNREWDDESSEMASDFGKKLADAQREAFEESVDFFSEIINGVIDGDIEDVLVGMLKRAAIQFGAEMLAQMTGNFSLQALMKGGMNFGVPGTPPPGTPPPGTPPGTPPTAAASPWASAGYAAGAYVGYEQYRGVKGIAEGQDVGDMDVTTRAALAFLTFGFSELFNAVGLGSLGDFGIKSTGKSREQQQRDSYRDALFEQGIISDPNATGAGGRKAEFALFGGGYGSLSPGSEFRGLNEGAGEYAGLGNVLNFASTGEFSGDLSAMFANALAEADSFNAAVLTTRGILEELGVTAEEAGFAMVDAYYKGEIGLDELNSGLNTLTAVANEDLPSLADGIDLFSESLDDPKSQIPALGLLFQEMAQAGIDSADEMKAFFAENFAPEVAESLNSIVDSGIDTFDELKNLTLGQTQLVINELDAAAKTQEGYTESVIRHGEESEKAAEKSARGLQKERQEVEKNARAYEDARRAKQRYFSEGSTQDFGPQAPG